MAEAVAFDSNANTMEASSSMNSQLRFVENPAAEVAEASLPPILPGIERQAPCFGAAVACCEL